MNWAHSIDFTGFADRLTMVDVTKSTQKVTLGGIFADVLTSLRHTVKSLQSANLGIAARPSPHDIMDCDSVDDIGFYRPVTSAQKKGDDDANRRDPEGESSLR